jgi:hypothetical protein
MADQSNIGEVVTEKVKGVEGAEADPKELSLEALLLLLTTERLHKLERDSKNELTELKKRQQQVSFLHKLSKALNTATSTKGELDLSKNQELKDMFAEAKELGVDIDEKKMKYNKDERDRLMDNIRMTIDDLNVQNDMQLQTVTRLTNERYESYQMARSILKPLHDVKIRKAQNIVVR